MLKFAANISMMFTEWPFLDRFGAAADAGFQAVEYLFPYDHPPEAIAARLQRHRLTQALFNMPPGDWAAGERGIAALPGRLEELKASVQTALVYAQATGAKRLHLMAGIANRDNLEAAASYETAVTYAAEQLAEHGIELLLEPINARSMPGYFLNDYPYAEALIQQLGLRTLRLQFDIFHRQIMHGDVSAALARLMPMIGHVQVASVPLRNEPDTGELNDGHIFRHLENLNYSGFIGCEYNPRGGTLAGLGWLHDAGAKQ
ncbi:2-oxo-tetronate isomerase [Acidocella sp.]|uniref:2-oxo-tetronate isomerase n=1 Tax=Acidocella sp. TaxID=50710 RepID=UPI001819766C|nr:2-oxo-tetronate isomerase [Acidocella sp.]NNM57221.1 hydroxypyruvate isomerase family protein [Acidocella sp.]